MPRALALTWELARSELPPATKKATATVFDQVLGLGLADWVEPEESIPQQIMDLVDQRQLARAEKHWADADAFRDEIAAAGYIVRDTPQGPQVKALKK
jgi:cysteinyl-tRNA synthetase